MWPLPHVPLSRTIWKIPCESFLRCPQARMRNVGTGVSPRVDVSVAEAMGLQLERHNDALFVFGIASDLGYEPTVSYIHSPRMKLYDSPDEAYCSLLGIKEYVADASQQVSDAECAANLRRFLEEHLVEMEQDGTRCWTLDKPRIVPWAFITWEV